MPSLRYGRCVVHYDLRGARGRNETPPPLLRRKVSRDTRKTPTGEGDTGRGSLTPSVGDSLEVGGGWRSDVPTEVGQ